MMNKNIFLYLLLILSCTNEVLSTPISENQETVKTWRFFKQSRKWTWKNLDIMMFAVEPTGNVDIDSSENETKFLTFEVTDFVQHNYLDPKDEIYKNDSFAHIISYDSQNRYIIGPVFLGFENDDNVFWEFSFLYPIYKFNMKVGDEIVSKESGYEYDDNYIGHIRRKVTHIDTICVNDVLRQRVIFDHSDFLNDISCWVEGIGPNRENGLIFPLVTNLRTEEAKLYSCYDGDECIFTEADFSAKAVNENRILGENRTFSECLGFEPSNDISENQKSVKFSYENNKLDVEFLSFVYSCGVRGVWPYAIVDKGQIKIVPDVEDDDADCMCHYNFSFSFPGIEPGKYTVMLMSDNGKEVKDTFELDLTDGFSQQFPDEPVKTDQTDSNQVGDVLFDGSLVEFNAGANSATMEIFSTEGELMAIAEGSGNVRLSTTSLMPGVYIFRVTLADGHAAQRKIVVK